MSGPPYIVWSPEGPTPPKISHPDHKSACIAMWHMSRRFPGQQFYVMGRTGKGAMKGPASHSANVDELHAMLAKIEAKRAAMDPEHRAALEAAELAAQRESWIRAFEPCEHGDYDWETCSQCRAPAQGIEAAPAVETARLDGNRESPVAESHAPDHTPYRSETNAE